MQVFFSFAEGGKVSNWILNHLKPGMKLEVDFPQGNFKLSKDAKKVVAFVAGSVDHNGDDLYAKL